MSAVRRVFQHDHERASHSEPGIAPGEVLSDGLRPTAFGQFAQTRLAAWLDRHRSVVARTGVALGLAAGLAAAALALRPAGEPPLPRARLTGVSIEVPAAHAGGGDARPIVATYRIKPIGSGTHVAVTGISGPFVKASVARPVAAPSPVSGAVVTVSAIADCTGAASLDTTKGPYLVTVTRTNSHGRSARERVRVPASPVDWAAAVREDCWQRRATRGIVIEGVGAERDAESHQLVLTVTLRSALPEDVHVRVIDVADVATLDAADSGTLRAGAEHAFRVRWPTVDCSLPVLPFSNVSSGTRRGRHIDTPALAWSIGPVGGDPAALFMTSLSPSQLTAVQDSVRLLCVPPATAIHITSSRVLPPDPAVADLTGVSIAVRLSLLSAASRIVIGQQQDSLTADARVPITQADVRLVNHKAEATIVWLARCSAVDPRPPLLPLHIRIRGHLVGYSVTLDDAMLAATYASACGFLDADQLRGVGWDLPQL
jgi:hypothetical protein